MRVRHWGGFRAKGPQEKKKPRLELGTAPHERDLQRVAVPFLFASSIVREVIDLVQDQNLCRTARVSARCRRVDSMPGSSRDESASID
jgi:hypothetical protein